MRPTSSREDANIRYIDAPGGYKIPVRRYGVDRNGDPVVMLHGLQSHSGWFTQSASFISGLGMPVYAMDRYGSGLSDAPKGSSRDLEDALRDIKQVVDHALKTHKKDKVHIVGHCYGALAACAFTLRHEDLIKSLLLSTPAIFTKASPPSADKLKIAWSKITGRNVPIPVPLKPDMMSELDEYITFAKIDPLALRTADAAFFFDIPRTRSLVSRSAGDLGAPVFMAMSGRDPICVNDKNRRFFEALGSRDKELKTYEKARHILEFSAQRDEFFKDLERWLKDHG